MQNKCKIIAADYHGGNVLEGVQSMKRKYRGITGAREKRHHLRQLLYYAGAEREIQDIRERAYALADSLKDRNPDFDDYLFVAIIESKVEEMRKAADEMEVKRLEALRLIVTVEDMTERAVLSMRYEKRKSWAQIARDMNYSREAAAYHERKALNKIIRAQPSLPSAPAPGK